MPISHNKSDKNGEIWRKRKENIFELIDEGNCIHIHTKNCENLQENHGFFSEENFIGSLSMVISCFLEYVYK